LLEGKSIELPDIKYLKLIAKLGDTSYPATEIENVICKIFEVSSPNSKNISADLIKNNILVLEDYRKDELKAVAHWVNRGWIDALILHLKTRNIKFSDNNVDDPDNFNAKVIKSKIDKEVVPEFWKIIDGERIDLPTATELDTGESFQDIIIRRRTHWKWRGTGIKIHEISNILYYGSYETVKLRKSAEKNWSTNPESILNSSFCAIETYLFVFNVESLPPGLYHYDLLNHSLVLIKNGLFREEVSKMCIGQQRPGEADCALVLTTNWKRYMYRYNHPRAYRTLLINTSELAQKYITLAASYKLVPFLTPAFEDQYADKLLEVNGYEEAPAYLLAFG
jgi:SagB-type dehydrogenase family enzyme